MIHPSALVDRSAVLDGTVSVGPYSVIGPGVEIAADTWIGAHVVIEGPTRIGSKNRIHPFASLGGAPQDKKYAGEPTSLEIGNGNVIREYCTLNRGTVQDEGVTRVGHDNWIMAYVHVAHDCRVGDHTIFANNAQLAGHVEVGDHAMLGGFTVVHQFVAIGAHALTAMGSILLQDLPPFVTAAGNTAKPHGLNTEGLKRRGFSPATLAGLRAAYKTLYKSGFTLEEAKAALAEQARELPEVSVLLDFVGRSRRGIVR